MSVGNEGAIDKGDFVLITYTGFLKDTNEIFDTTDEDVAKTSGLYDSNAKYGPTLIIVGEGRVIKGLEESLIGHKEGDEYEVEIPPEKGFGIRDSKKLVTTTIKKLRESGIKDEITVGKILNIDGKPAIVRAVVSGRVMLDFNPPLAGKYLKYRVKVVKRISSLEEKIIELIRSTDQEFLNAIKEYKIDVNEGTLIINLEDKSINNPKLHLAKKVVGERILKCISEIKRLRFIEEISHQVALKQS
ncbi:MAG: peptidylprolyl isomerase [Candidatus Geothermarchaeota archaeon]